MKTFIGAALAVLTATSAHAQTATTVYNTDLPIVNTTTGSGVATTTDLTGAVSGRVTTVAGPGGGANRVNAPGAYNTWLQENVGGNASVGITTQYAHSGNGSAVFTGVDGNSKADLEYYLNAPIQLAAFKGASYDWYRNSTSTTAANQVPSLRMLIGNAAGAYQGYLIFEPVYNGVPTAPTDSWQTSTITTDSIYWSNNGNLVSPGGSCPSCFDPLSSWIASNPTATILGFSTGIGSGWSGTFNGAVDNIKFSGGGISTVWNFEVSAGAVPETATWATMIAGFGLVGGALRRRDRTLAAA